MTQRRAADVISVVALLAGFGLSLGLVFGAWVTGFSCGLLGDRCTSAEVQQVRLLELAAISVFVVVPVVVALVRRQARWLLAPVIEAALLVGIVVANDWF